MSADRPNVLILMTDQQRADCMGCAGHPVLQTPNIDRIASEGLRFSHACTSSPICMPARASFISGLHPHNHNMWHNSGRLPEGEESLFRRLQQAGYRTAHTGKSHYYAHSGQHLRDEEPYMHARGFDDVHETTGPWATVTTDSYMTDHWDELGLLDAFRDDYRKRREHEGIAVWPSPLPEAEFLDSYIGRTAKEYLEQYSRAEPFCLFVGFGGPHEPWDAPGRYAEMYDPAQMPSAIPPGEPGEWLAEHAAEALAHTEKHNLSDEVIGAIRASYYGKISLIDDWFGELLGVLDDRGWTDDTLVVFWSDHGEMAGDHQRLHKSVFLESALRVPLMLRWPSRVEAGQECDALATTVDVCPTILEGLGIEVGRRCQGQSLWPVIEDAAAPLREAVFSEIAPAPLGHIMVRTAEWKYAISAQGDGMMLYDLRSDPDEQTNLVGHPDYREVEAEMRDRILRFLSGAQPRR